MTHQATIKQLQTQLDAVNKQIAALTTTTGKVRQRRTYTAAEKVSAVGRIAAGQKARAVAEELGVDERLLSLWKTRIFRAAEDQRSKKK